MIGFQKLIVDQNIKVTKLAEELGVKPGRIWDWIQNNKVSKKFLDIIAKKFNVDKNYLNEKVNDISTYEPRGKGFNEYIIDGNVTYIKLRQRPGKEELITTIDTDELEKLIELNVSWHPQWFDFTQSYYASAGKYLGIFNGKPKYKIYKLHDVIMNTNKRVDHINHDTLDNRKENLRFSDVVKNATNRKSKNKNNTTGHRNVILDKDSGKYIIVLCIKNKRFRVGKLYTDVHEAGKDAEMYRKEYYGEFAGEN